MDNEPAQVAWEPHRSSRIHNELFGFLMSQGGEMVLSYKDKPTSNKEAIEKPDSEKWLQVMKSEMDSMYTK